MNRPSHWILGFLAVLGGSLWWTGALQDYLSARPSAEARVEQPKRGPVVIRSDAPPPRPTNSEVSGRVVDRMGFPVVSARVRVAGEGGEPVTTDARGRFRLTVSGAVHKRLRIEAPGRHDPVEVQGSVDELAVVLQDALPWETGAPTTVADQPKGLLVGEGWVKDHDGRRVAGARVTVRETGATALTDENGQYVMPLTDGPYTLVAYDGEGGVATSRTMTPPRPQGKVPLPELQLESGPTLRGRLISAEGEPLADAALRVETGGIQRVARTEQGGWFTIAGLVPGECELIVLPHRGHLGTRVPLVIEQDANLNEVVVQRPQQEPLRLSVVDAIGSAQPFCHVVAEQLGGLTRAYGQADAEGVVTLRGLGQGGIEFEVRDPALQPLAVTGFDEARRTLVVTP